MKKQTERALDISLTVLFVVALTVFIITFSIGLPIYCRFFYYIQIKTLKLEQATGWSYETIKTAYDDVLNFCTLPNYPFGTGELSWTASEAAHFADCKTLFNLNLSGIICGGAISLTLILLNRFKIIKLCRPFGHGAQLIAAVIAIALPLLIGLIVLIAGFDRAFVAFHAVFFPGKDNWTFNPYTEQIINVMPEEFFLNCVIIIGAGLLAFSAAIIIAEAVLTKKRMNSAKDCVDAA